MQNLTAAQKGALDTAARASGVITKYVGYNPNTMPVPSAPNGYFEYHRETTANLVEIIYTSALVTKPV